MAWLGLAWLGFARLPVDGGLEAEAGLFVVLAAVGRLLALADPGDLVDVVSGIT